MQMTVRLVLRPCIYRRPCALQVQAKANIVLLKLNNEKQKANMTRELHDDGGGDSDILDVNSIDCRDFILSI